MRKWKVAYFLLGRRLISYLQVVSQSFGQSGTQIFHQLWVTPFISTHSWSCLLQHIYTDWIYFLQLITSYQQLLDYAGQFIQSSLIQLSGPASLLFEYAYENFYPNFNLTQCKKGVFKITTIINVFTIWKK